MKISVRVRVLSGFAVVLGLLVITGAAGVRLVHAIDGDVATLSGALQAKSDASGLDLLATKVRVRVNQWLRSMNPDFAHDADGLLKDTAALVATMAVGQTGETAATIQSFGRALTAYTESWRVIQGYYAEEASIYGGLDRDGLAMRTGFSELRDALLTADNVPAVRLVIQARDFLLEASDDARRYRGNVNADEQTALHQAIAASQDALRRVTPLLSASGTLPTLQRLEAALATWQGAFDRGVAVTALRIARLNSWTKDEGEVMAKAADSLRVAATSAALRESTTVRERIDSGEVLLAVSMGVALLTGIGLSLALARSITRPLLRVTSALRLLAGGDRAVDVPETSRQDEIGEVARAAQVFKENAQALERMAADQAGLQARAVADQQASLNRLADAFEQEVGGMVRLLASGSGELRTTAEALTGTAGQSTAQAETVANSAGHASSGVQTVAAAAEQLTASIGEISRQVAESSRMTGLAVTEAQRTDSLVRTLSDAVQKIGDVVGLISSIAGQTNLLALNATIEAARAGDAGKGFAVVASEVKNLATQTGRATEEIGAQIAQIQAATRQAVEAIRGITTTVETISATATSIASAVEQQGAATAEIARNVQQTAVSTREVTVTIGGVREAANDTGVAASQVLQVATSVSEQADLLSREVNQFVSKVRVG